MGTACYVRGAEQLMRAFENELGVKQGETTADGRFSLRCVRCVGACGLAPVAMIGKDLHSKVKSDQIGEVASSRWSGELERSPSAQCGSWRSAGGGTEPQSRDSADESAAQGAACAGGACVSCDNASVTTTLRETRSGRRGLTDYVKVVETGCVGCCDLGVVVQVSPTRCSTARSPRRTSRRSCSAA